MNKIKKYFLALIILELLFSYAPAFAQTTQTAPVYSGPEAQITQYLCTPNSPQANGLFSCINQLYKFAIVVGCVMGVFFIVIAGFVYMSAEGNQESVDKAKSIITSSITALVILLAGYLFLYTLNPDLTSFQSIQPPNAPAVTATTGTGGTSAITGTSGSVTGNGGTAVGSAPHGTLGSGNCVPIANANSPASVANLQNTCLAPNATIFSEISDEEDGGGNPQPSGSDKCADGNSVSFGYFQINITATQVGGLNCPAAFSKPYTGSDHSCTVTDKVLYQQCVTAALDTTVGPNNKNIQAACALSNNGTNLSAWNGSCYQTWVSN